MDPILVIANAEADPSDDPLLAAALEVLRAEASVELASTSSSGDLDGVLHRAGSRRIIVAGGDQNMHAVVAALYRRYELKTKVLGLLPMGTGTEFARTNGLPLDVRQAAQVALRGVPRPTDILLDEVGAVVINEVWVGAGPRVRDEPTNWSDRLAEFGADTLNRRRLGWAVGRAIDWSVDAVDTPMRALRASVRPSQIRLRIEVDGRVVSDFDQPLSGVRLSRHRGNQAIGDGPTGKEVTLDANASSHQIEITLTRASGPLDRYHRAIDSRRRRSPGPGAIANFRGSQVTISGQDFWCRGDGASYGPERRRSWHVEPAAYALLVP
ncbi:MAG: diacylglycerol/lipid kinase family protein [Nocardioides sp.]